MNIFTHKKPFLFFLLLFCLIAFTICRKLPKEMLVSTGEVSGITKNSAEVTGTVLDLGEGATQHGHCYGTSPNVSVTGSNLKTQLGVPPVGGFTSQLTNLIAGTKYYVKAYITGGTDTKYGDEINFTTEAAAVPELATTAVSSITTTTATSGGNITSDGGATVTVRGVCWNTATGPSISNSKTTDGSGIGSFTSNLSSLTPGTTYYVRAYATNSTGTAYGNELNFTSTAISPPTLSTTAISTITTTTAMSGGSITNDGGASITARGVCWSATTGPTIAGNKTTDATGTGNYTSVITGLTPGSTYYVRAYATNSAGTSYGNELSFTTTPELPVLTTTTITSITQTTATSGGNISGNGGSSVTFRGVCWSTTTGPTTASSKTTDGAGSGTFTSSLTGLTANTTYYVRAYAINNAGTAYGNELTFTTNPAVAVIPILSTTAITSITQTTAASGGNITSDGGAAVTVRGVCWGTTTGPTISGNKTSDATGPGVFVSNITGLTAGTKYYVRAYATNSVGTAYGDEVSFTTSSVAVVVPTLTTTAVSALASTSVNSGGNITNDGGASVTARGVCWGASANPTIANSKTSDGTGSGIFGSSLTGLTANTTYYVRAYATNSAGTAYGDGISFTTTIQLTDFDGNIYNTVKIGTQLWLQENLKTTSYRDGTSIKNLTDNTSWTSQTSGAYCWYNNDIGNKNIYGAMYNYFATVENLNLCPTGWHVPTDAEWTILTTYLGGEAVAGGKLKETGYDHWGSPNTGATNETGFTGRGGGHRYALGFESEGAYGWWWTASEESSLYGYYREMSMSSGDVLRSSCEKYPGKSVRCIQGEGQVLPAVTTTSISAITTSGASSGGNVTSDGGASVTARGVCWSTFSNPTISLTTKTTDGPGSGSYASSLTGLTESTTFYVRAYATNSVGTAYGNEVSFTTNPAVMPTLSTASVTGITGTTAVSGGNITSDGGGSISVRGVCWDVTSPPTTGDNRTLNGPGAGTYVSNMTGLTPNTTYYVRAYATNSAGTAYGNEVTLTTLASVTSAIISNITPTTASGGGTITVGGGAIITGRGICWSTTGSPTTGNSKTDDGTGTGSFISNLTALLSATTYYVRAYATNISGTAYGDQVSFTTSLTVTHTSGDVAPVTKTVTYGIVETNLTGSNKKWITQNLGADNQASSATDATEASAGWYWQFNRKQGYKYDGARTPNTSWITSIDEASDWISANDPCTLLLGAGWHLPVITDWISSDNNGGWNNYSDTYASILKLHNAGSISYTTGLLSGRGGSGNYWSSTSSIGDNTYGTVLCFYSAMCTTCGSPKAYGSTLRCIKD